MNVENVKCFITQLRNIQCSLQKEALIDEFQKIVWDSDDKDWRYEELRELAYDLDFYESNPIVQQESPSYYGEDTVNMEIEKVVQLLEHSLLNFD